ncbi:MAG: hypothetical protein H7X99_01585 [Saprospiraceae bacterium]|nr:hypothetical protein [Saprospiraceae bacterium]
MTEHDIIIVDAVPQQTYLDIAMSAARYALISVAFTYNRMDKKDIRSRVINITKGKIAEGLLYFYGALHGIRLDHQSCTTPFWMPDHRDFLFKNGEWDLKNNFIYCSDTDFNKLSFTALPALIPNKYGGDQWSKRDKHYMEYSRYSAYLFTFMRLRPDSKAFFDLSLTEEQLSFLSGISQTYQNTAYSRMPFMESWFWDTIPGFMPYDFLRLNYYPELIITGCANARYWHFFKDTGPLDSENHYKDYGRTQWYTTGHGQITKFLNGTIVTTIKNKTCPVGLLPSFKSVFNQIPEF